MLSLEAEGRLDNERLVPEIFVAHADAESEMFCQQLVYELRGLGVSAERDTTGRSLKAQMKYADKKKARYTLIIGDSELESKKAQLKNMDNSNQTEIDLGNVDALKEILSAE